MSALFYCVADVHLGNHRRFGGPMQAGLNRRFHQTADVLRIAIDHVYQHRAPSKTPALFVLGDLFDSSRPSVAEVASAMSVLDSCGEVAKYLLLGNHDMHSEEEHALATMHYLNSVAIYGNLQVRFWNDYAYAAMPFNPRPPHEWLVDALQEADRQLQASRARSDTRILFVHLGISDDETPAYLRGAHDSINVDELAKLMERFGFTHCYAGNWHNHKRWDVRGRTIVQCGALVPTGFDNPGFAPYGGLIEHRSDGTIHRHVLPGPRFVKLVYEDGMLADLKDYSAPGDMLYVSVTARPPHVKQASAELAAMIERGDIVDGEVIPDRESATATARAASRAAVSATNIDEAIANYVDRVKLPEGAQRAEVLSLVKRYLAR